MLDPGKHEEHIQFARARKIQSAYLNVHHASKMMKEVTVMAFEITSCMRQRVPPTGTGLKDLF
jgi:hypothetical protein